MCHRLTGNHFVEGTALLQSTYQTDALPLLDGEELMKESGGLSDDSDNMAESWRSLSCEHMKSRPLPAFWGSQNYQTSMLLPSSVATIPDVVGPVLFLPIFWSKQSKYSRLFSIRSIKKQMTLLTCFLETVRMEWDGMERKDGDAGPLKSVLSERILSPSTSLSFNMISHIWKKELSHWLELNIYT